MPGGQAEGEDGPNNYLCCSISESGGDRVPIRLNTPNDFESFSKIIAVLKKRGQ